MLGDVLYTWSVNRHTSFSVPSSTTTQGDVGGAPFTATTMGLEDVHMHLQCTLTVATDTADIVKHFSFEGNAGCDRFRNALDR